MKVAQESHWRLASNPPLPSGPLPRFTVIIRTTGNGYLSIETLEIPSLTTHSQVKSTGHDHNLHADQTWVDQHDQLRLCSKLP